MNFDELNDEQKEAVTTTEGFVRVIAGAGSGKTRALSHRFAYLVNDIGILPSHILCVTFTNKAANEMRNRIRKLTGDNDTGYISTFHGFCVSVLQEDSNAVNYPKSFLVLDNSDIDAMLQLIYEERELTLRQMTFSNARDMIEIRKLEKEPDYYNDLICMPLGQIYQKYMAAVKPDDIIFYGYLYQQKKCFGLDYNDLLKFVLYIFRENPDIRQKWQERLEYIMIDEFQDIDKIQYELMEVLCDYHKNLFIVGDPDQTIYTWRGANVHYLLDFDKKFPGTQTIMMMRNYRSTPQIIAAANSLIDKNQTRMKKDLIPTKENWLKVMYYHAKSASEEAGYIADQILSLTKNGEFAPSDIAVLFRAHYISRDIEEVLQKKQIEYTLSSGLPFFDRLEIKDCLSYLRMIAYKDDLSFLRTVNSPKRNVGERRIKFLKEYAAQNNCSLYQALRLNTEEELFANTKAKEYIDLIEDFAARYKDMEITKLMSFVMDKSGYERSLRTEGSQERLDNLAELKQGMYEYETTCGEEATLENYLAHAALFTNADAGTTKNAVKLMTVHAAKGLEFPIVFLCGMNENMFPSKKIDSITAMEEERRLAFVAYTRAEHELIITEAEGTKQAHGFRFPSRFIFDTGKENLDFKTDLPEHVEADALRYIKDSNDTLAHLESKGSLKEGDRVEHAILGQGTVTQIDPKAHTYLIKFDNIQTPRKMSFKSPIKKL